MPLPADSTWCVKLPCAAAGRATNYISSVDFFLKKVGGTFCFYLKGLRSASGLSYSLTRPELAEAEEPVVLLTAVALCWMCFVIFGQVCHYACVFISLNMI